MMFSNVEENYRMLMGAYKKLKAYYHYNKNFLFMKKKIADFEYNAEGMENRLRHLSLVMMNPTEYEQHINQWIEQIDYYVLPKSFKEERKLSDRFVANNIQTNKPINKVNFFINMPIELHLLETVWTLFIGKFIFDKKNIISKTCYGNVLDNQVIYNSEDDLRKSINFGKNKLFKIYFGQYCAWKNKAINIIDQNKKNKSMLMISLDIQSYYYSVKWKFSLLDEFIGNDNANKINSLTLVIERIFDKYTRAISAARILQQRVEQGEYVLPIGLFCSMVLANLYLSDFDKAVVSKDNVLYYGRYVDDMLIVIDVSKDKFAGEEESLNHIVIENNAILVNSANDTYSIYKHQELLIQKKKLKVIYFECGKSDLLINQLKKTEIIPSQMNVVPNNDLSMTDFEEAAYVIQNFTTETKIREFGQLEINRFQLGWHMAELVRNSKYKLMQLSKVEKTKRQAERRQILSFFQGSNALEYSSNWTNALYFLMLTRDSDRYTWKQFESNIRNAIKGLRVENPEDIKKGKSNAIKSIMKKQLYEQFNICIATVLALNPNFYRKETSEAKQLAYKLRRANYFNHYLVAYPLINYIDNINEDVDLTNVSLEQLHEFDFNIQDSRKMFYTPRFINLDELFQYAFLESISHEKGWSLSENKIEYIRKMFYTFNNINENFARPLQIEVGRLQSQENYYLQEIKLTGKKYNLHKLRIAVANVKLGITDCCLGLEKTAVMRNRTDFANFLKEAYENKNGKVDFLLFPEFYLPMEWLSDVLLFVRKSGITIIAGLQYITQGTRAYNTIGIFTQIYSGKYKSACMIIREKNDYAPLEKKLLAVKGYRCRDHEKSIYTIVNCGKLSFGTFLCYEFTDIVARSLYKDKVDVLFTPENNNDTTYFSNIIETMSRDLHAIVVQANTSIYGDSRITGPYSRDQRNIVQIKGGDNDSIIIGTIDLDKIRFSRKEERKKLEDDIKIYFNAGVKEKYKIEKELIKSHELKIAKISAKTKY